MLRRIVASRPTKIFRYFSVFSAEPRLRLRMRRRASAAQAGACASIACTVLACSFLPLLSPTAEEEAQMMTLRRSKVLTSRGFTAAVALVLLVSLATASLASASRELFAAPAGCVVLLGRPCLHPAANCDESSRCFPEQTVFVALLLQRRVVSSALAAAAPGYMIAGQMTVFILPSCPLPAGSSSSPSSPSSRALLPRARAQSAAPRPTPGSSSPSP